jgi:ribosomal protein S3
MGQKINPVSLRLQSTNRHFDNCWYSNYFYKDLINKDVFLQNYLNNFLKAMKIPTGRYSIQHLQKKTQILNFFCSSKPTRQWRSKLLGLTQKHQLKKKNRYFLKTGFSKSSNLGFESLTKTGLLKFQKQTRFTQFFQSLNQLAVHRIQKRITSFQNYELWSKKLKLEKNKNKIFNVTVFPIFRTSKNYQQLISFPKFKQQSNASIQKYPLAVSTRQTNLLDFATRDNKKIDNLESHFGFLQNLFIYKTLHLIQKNQRISNYSLDQTQSSLKARIIFDPINFKYRNYLESSLSSFYKLPIDLIPFRVKNDWQHASYLAEELVFFLEKRIPFRRLKAKLFKQLSQIPSIRGVRISCSGRVGGKSKKAQRSKTECMKYGQTSLHVFSSKIDFSVKTAFTRFGSVGVKVWICYN